MKQENYMTKRLEVSIAGLRLQNPTILAAGILGITRATLIEAIDYGAGAVVTKSVGSKPQEGYHNPAVVHVNCGLLNAMGLPNPGISEFANEVREIKKARSSVPIIVSVFGFSAEDFAETARFAAKAGADAVELNVSCPHVKKTGLEIGQSPSLVAEVVKKVKSIVHKPVIVKLTPNVADIVEIARLGAEAGADAITAINTVRAMAIDVETAYPVLANEMGGLSGPAIKPVAVGCIYSIYESVNVPIIGCGGVTTWQDAVELMLAGASAVQIGTAIASEGLGIFKYVANGIDLFLKRKGFGSVEDIVGLSHRH
jgi:dihydroorotate dehydrogenase (NAD+) catalytic subunit